MHLSHLRSVTVCLLSMLTVQAMAGGMLAKPTPHDGHICEVDTIFDTAFCCDFSISVTDKPKNCVTCKSFHVAWEAFF